jgi:hypothetical protein
MAFGKKESEQGSKNKTKQGLRTPEWLALEKNSVRWAILGFCSRSQSGQSDLFTTGYIYLQQSSETTTKKNEAVTHLEH